MTINAVFESWHVGDGNYPPLTVGELVNLSFEFEPEKIQLAGGSPTFRHIGNARYSVVAEAIRVYRDRDGPDLVVFQAGDFSFYSCGDTVKGVKVGATIHAVGTLLLDHYIWVEFLQTYPDPPDLFYDLCVTSILKVQIPERFISRQGSGKSWPTCVELSEVDANSVQRLETMDGQPFDEEFYIVEFERIDSGENIPRTFL